MARLARWCELLALAACAIVLIGPIALWPNPTWCPSFAASARTACLRPTRYQPSAGSVPLLVQCYLLQCDIINSAMHHKRAYSPFYGKQRTGPNVQIRSGEVS